MNLENIPQKQLSELERLTHEIQVALRKAKLQDDPLHESLRRFEQELSEIRRKRFDESNPEYRGY
jgi:hypothetical protein